MMADENVNAEIPIEENGAPDAVDGNEEASDVSSSIQKDEEEGKGYLICLLLVQTTCSFFMRNDLVWLLVIGFDSLILTDLGKFVSSSVLIQF